MTGRVDVDALAQTAKSGIETYWSDTDRGAAYEAVDDLVGRVRELEAALREYGDHQSWRCQYRARYKECCCGLDDTLAKLGLPPSAVDDPEARREASA